MAPEVHSGVHLKFIALTLNLASPQPITFNLN